MTRLDAPRTLTIAVGISVLVAGCGTESITDHGTASAELTVVPANVLCLRFQLSGSTVATKDFAVAAGTSSVSLDLGILNPGSLTVNAYAYSVACTSVTPATTADWVGGPITATIVAGAKTDIAITLVPNPSTTGTVDFVVPVEAISAGSSSTYALLQDGTVKAWGVGVQGQIGDGFYVNRLTPVPVSGLSGVRSVASGSTANHACAIRSDGSLACWGYNSNGQIGDGTLTSRAEPVAVSSAQQFAQVAAGGLHTCAINLAAQVYCWGYNSQGQLGDRTTISRLVPAGTSFPLGEQLQLGAYFSAVRRNQSVFSAGQNAYGQFGDGTTVGNASPVWTMDGSTWPAEIATGAFHRCALMVADGAVRCVGYNGSGQLGDGTTISRSLPVSVIGISGARAVAGGGSHTCAIATDRAVWCWGANNRGQLGDATTSFRYAPVRVSGIDNAIALTVGGAHSCALRNDGTVWCWGENVYGQLGDGTVFDRPIPTKVKF